MQFIRVSKNDSGQRLDKYLIKYFDRVAKSFVYKNLRKENIRLNNKKATGDMRIFRGDEIEFYFSSKTLKSLSSHVLEYAISPNEKSWEKFPHSSSDISALISSERSSGTLDNYDILKYGSIVFEDDNIIVFNKKVGVLSQKARPHDISLNEILLNYVNLENHEKKGGAGPREAGQDVFIPSICNRLDRNTGGLVIFAKNYAASVQVSTLFKEHKIKKYYLAVVSGKVAAKKTLKGWLIKNDRKNIVSVSSEKSPGAFYIEMSYEPIKIFKNSTILKIDLRTGRTHQIRAQLAKASHPVLGDTKYGSIKNARRLKQMYGVDHQLLYAWKLVWPSDLKNPLRSLKGMTMTIEMPTTIQKIYKSV